jgi:mono/diheme cytochrome c family protein
MSRRHLRRSALVPTLLVVVSLGLAACSQESSPEVPLGAGGEADPVLVEGREVWSSNCARCHGADGGGGSGVKLSDGRAEELHPEIDTMIDVVAEGKGAMPAFGGSLSDEEIEAVVRYVREVL